jgi:nitroreductase
MMTNKSVIDVIMSRRSVRKYKPEQVEETLLSAVIEAGRAAPSGGNAQLTHIIVIQNDDAKRELIRISKEEFAKMTPHEDMYLSLRSTIERAQDADFHFDFIYSAPTFIVAANKKERGNAMADSSCALQNMMLAAAALGLGSCWINPLHWLDDNKNLREYMYTLGLGQDETITGALSLGYSAEDEPRTPLPRTGNPVSYIR